MLGRRLFGVEEFLGELEEEMVVLEGVSGASGAVELVTEKEIEEVHKLSLGEEELVGLLEYAHLLIFHILCMQLIINGIIIKGLIL